MAKKLRKTAKTGVHELRKMPVLPKSMTILPADTLFFIDSQVQLELLKREMERTCPTHRTGALKTTALMQVSDDLPTTKALALT